MARPQQVSQEVQALEENFIHSGFGYMNLSGVMNARDLGGMPTIDGKVIQPGRLIRSGKLEHAKEGDARLLNDLGLRTIVDFRMERERELAPDPIEKFSEASIEFIPVVNPSSAQGAPSANVAPGSSLRDVLQECKGSNDAAREFIHALYEQLALSEAGRKGFREFFEVVIATAEQDADSAVLWHCSAGKDRTGVAAALLQYVLGVPHALIIADYNASNLYTKTIIDDALLGLSDIMNENVRELVHMYYGVDDKNLLGAVAAVSKKYGSVDTYIEQELKVSPAAKKHLKELYLHSA